VLPEEYHFRDDALLMYDAIKTYVTKYISLYYCKYWTIFLNTYLLFKENIFIEIDLKYMLLPWTACSTLKGAIIHIGFNFNNESNYKAYQYKCF